MDSLEGVSAIIFPRGRPPGHGADPTLHDNAVDIIRPLTSRDSIYFLFVSHSFHTVTFPMQEL